MNILQLRCLMPGFLALAWIGLPAPANADQVCESVMVGTIDGGNGGVGGPVYEDRCWWAAGAVAFNVATRAVGFAWNQPDADVARSQAVRSCNDGCVGVSFYEDSIYVAMDDDDKAYGVSTASSDDAIEQCSKDGGTSCSVVIVGGSSWAGSYRDFSAVAYDMATGRKGISMRQRRMRDAVDEAKARCDAPECWSFGFQGRYGAIARSSTGKLFGGWSTRDGRIFNAERDARKECKKATGEKQCEIVVSLTSKTAEEESARRAEEDRAARQRKREETEAPAPAPKVVEGVDQQ